MAAPAVRPPLYQRIETMLREAIAEGRYAVGTLLPTEAELCETLRVSRHTIREALRRLVQAGLVERRQGAGTLVVARQPPRDFTQSMRDLAGLYQYAVDTRLVVQGRKLTALTAEEAALVPVEPGARWLRVEGLRVTPEGDAICSVVVLVHPRFGGIAAALPERGAIYAAIEERYGVEVAEVEQQITAGLLPSLMASALDRKGRAIGMRFVRRYLDATGATLLVSINWHPAERYTYSMRLRRDDDAA